METLVDANPVKRNAFSSDGRELLEPAIKSYREQISSYIDLDRLLRSQQTVVVDPMHGSGGRWVESFLTGGALKVETFAAIRDPLLAESIRTD